MTEFTQPHEGWKENPDIPRFSSDENDMDWSNSPEMDAQEEAVADEMYRDPPPPEYKDEDPDEDFPPTETQEDYDKQEFEREKAEHEYRQLLEDARKALSEVNLKLHQYMMHTPGGASSDRWREAYILTRHIHALADTISLYQRHSYAPF